MYLVSWSFRGEVDKSGYCNCVVVLEEEEEGANEEGLVPISKRERTESETLMLHRRRNSRRRGTFLLFVLFILRYWLWFNLGKFLKTCP